MNHKTSQYCYNGLLKAIKLAGGQTALAKLCGEAVRQPHVYNWLKRNKNKMIPCEYVLAIEKALNGKITRSELRPDIYPPEDYK